MVGGNSFSLTKLTMNCKILRCRSDRLLMVFLSALHPVLFDALALVIRNLSRIKGLEFVGETLVIQKLTPVIPNLERLFPKLSQVYTNICAVSRGARTFVL